jgi:hypothetical protein
MALMTTPRPQAIDQLDQQVDAVGMRVDAFKNVKHTISVSL